MVSSGSYLVSCLEHKNEQKHSISFESGSYPFGTHNHRFLFMKVTLDQFVAKWLGRKADFDGAYGGQCVDLFRFYVKEVLNLPQPKPVKGAKDFWYGYAQDPNLFANYEKIPNTLWAVPKKGDVMVWDAYKGNPFGHVAIYLDGNVLWFTSFDQNFPTLSRCTKTRHNYLKPKVLGWLRRRA